MASTSYPQADLIGRGLAGKPVTFRGNRFWVAFLLIMGTLGGAIGLIDLGLLLFAIATHGLRPVQLILFPLLGGLIWTGVSCYRKAAILYSLKITAGENEICFATRTEIIRFDWNDIARCYWEFANEDAYVTVRQMDPGRSCPSISETTPDALYRKALQCREQTIPFQISECKLASRGGQEMRLRSVHGIRKLGDLVWQHTFDRMLLQDVFEYVAGRELDFGRIRIARDSGISFDEDTWPFEQILEYYIEHGILQIRLGGRRRPFLVGLKEVPNVFVLLALLDAILAPALSKKFVPKIDTGG